MVGSIFGSIFAVAVGACIFCNLKGPMILFCKYLSVKKEYNKLNYGNMTYDIYESKVQDIINLFNSQKTMTFMQNS